MARKIKPTRKMKIKDPNTDRDSRYAVKAWNAKKKGIFTKNSPFNPINHNKTIDVFDGITTFEDFQVKAGLQPKNIVDIMIEKKRGISDEKLKQLAHRKFEVDESRTEAV